MQARNIGLTLTMVLRVGLVFLAGWVITLMTDILRIGDVGFSIEGFILVVGGLFLVYKAVHEILALDLVLSLDSVSTAAGMATKTIVTITAVVPSFGTLLFASRFIFLFVNRYPTVKMLALLFLLLIGAFLVAEGFGLHIDKALIYGPMALALFVEALIFVACVRRAKRERDHRDPVTLPPRYAIVDESVAVAAATPRTRSGRGRPVTSAGRWRRSARGTGRARLGTA